MADTGNHAIRVIADGRVETWAGPGEAGHAGYRDAPERTGALFNRPMGLALDRAGNLYVADGGNAVIRKVSAVPPMR